jgi:ATP-dependent DNA helicase RecQ
MVQFYFFRGKEFREDYSRIGEMRSLLTKACVLALTASAPPSMVKDICSSLHMGSNFTLVQCSPDRPNIFIMAMKAPNTVSETFHWLADELSNDNKAAKKYIIYCRSIKACALLYKYFSDQLGPENAYARGEKKGVRSRLFGMFHRSTVKKNKKVVMESFGQSHSNLRVVIATVAYGMGIDIPDVHMVIQWGCPRNIAEFYQEAGRAGRDSSLSAYSMIYYHGMDVSAVATDPEMRQYCLNGDNICRRKQIVNHFHPTMSVSNKDQDSHTCCDVCLSQCTCGKCPALPWKSLDRVTDNDLVAALKAAEMPVREITDHAREELTCALQLFQEGNSTNMVNGAILTGLDTNVISDIVCNVHHIFAYEDLLSGYMYSAKFASQVMDIINEIIV